MIGHRVVFGIQELLVLSSVPAGQEALLGKHLIGAGAINVAGAYECAIDTSGLSDIEVDITTASVSGSFAPSLISTFLDKTADTTAAGANFASGSQNLALTGLKGVRRCVYKFTVPGGGAVTHTRAEVRGI